MSLNDEPSSDQFVSVENFVEQDVERERGIYRGRERESETEGGGGGGAGVRERVSCQVYLTESVHAIVFQKSFPAPNRQVIRYISNDGG